MMPSRYRRLPGIPASADSHSALGEGLMDLESYGSREFSLLLIEAVKVVRSEFESCGNMQQVRSTGPQPSRGPTGQLAGPLKDLLGKRAQEKDPIAQVFLEVTQGCLHL